MKIPSTPSRILVLIAMLTLHLPLSAATPKSFSQEQMNQPVPVLWQSAKAEHVYGLPDIRHNTKGTLVLANGAFTFTSKAGNSSIPWSSVTAVSAGNERVEVGGVGMRLFRMTIPDGGGLVAAAVMHHRIDMLTVQFNDRNGGNHAAVFIVPAIEADRALQSFSATAAPPRPVANLAACHSDAVDQNSVLVDEPNWEQAEVPAVYRALVYEHLIDRLRNTGEVGHIYRAGENTHRHGCPQYTIHIAIVAFREGSSVKRAYLGPVGMFVGTTQMVFDISFTDASGKLNGSEQIKATMRGESESTSVADHVAKSATKRFIHLLKDAGKHTPASSMHSPPM